ncbi:MAG TPA: septum formation initiator family protein [Terriglobales bacterium]|nr:septum formation initiator family protein [Terriglobales bacterium]
MKFRGIRELPRPEDGLRALVDRAPEAEAALDGLRERLRPAAEVVYRIRRRLATAAVGLLTVWLFVHVMFSPNGMVAYKEKRAEIEVLRKEVDALQRENDSYAQQIKALKSDPKAIEKEAREQLHYARPGEVVYVAPPPAVAPGKSVSNLAKKRN